MAGKNPAFQFYPGDWFREPGLKVVDLNVRGAWAELLMVMWDQKPQGVIETHIDGLAKLWRVSPEEACFIVDELAGNAIADVKFADDECREIVASASEFFQGLSEKIEKISGNVPFRPGNVPRMSPFRSLFVKITNRRMLRGWNDKEKERLKKQRQRTKPAVKEGCPADVPEKSPSHSSSSFSSNTLSGVSAREMDQPKSGTKAPKKITTVAPENFDLTPELVTWAQAQGCNGNLQAITDSFLDHHRAKGSKFIDWVAAWRTWVRNEVKFAKPIKVYPLDRSTKAKREQEAIESFLRG